MRNFQRDKLYALDLFCGGGGVAQGLLEAGFDEVVGIDNDKRCKRAYPGHFVLGDVGKLPVRISDFDFVWSSPPCQRYSTATPVEVREQRPDWIPFVRKLLKPHPYTVIENVPKAPIRPDLILSGPMFGLDRIVRVRHFETSFYALQPDPIYNLRKDAFKDGYGITITTSMSSRSHYYNRKRIGLTGRVGVKEAREVMGIKINMTGRQIGEAIPPPFARYIAEKVLRLIEYDRKTNGIGTGQTTT